MIKNFKKLQFWFHSSSFIMEPETEPEPEPKLRNLFGSGSGSSQKGRLRAAPAPAPQLCYLGIHSALYLLYVEKKVLEIVLGIYGWSGKKLNKLGMRGSNTSELIFENCRYRGREGHNQTSQSSTTSGTQWNTKNFNFTWKWNFLLKRNNDKRNRNLINRGVK